jgi:hypothetical protein
MIVYESSDVKAIVQALSYTTVDTSASNAAATTSGAA